MLSRCSKIGYCLASLIAVSGCTSDRLSEQECRAIRDREVAHMASLAPSSPLPPGADDRAIAQCVAGELYSRKDFECIAAASTDLAMSRCMAQAHEKAGR